MLRGRTHLTEVVLEWYYHQDTTPVVRQIERKTLQCGQQIETNQRSNIMTKASHTLLAGIEPQAVIDHLNSLYAYEMLAMNWAIVVGHQLEGTALLMLQAEIDTQAQESLTRATEIARRIGQLDGELVAHPELYLEQAPLSKFTLPRDYSNIADILNTALEYEQEIIPVYHNLVVELETKDRITAFMAMGLLQQHVTRADDLETSLVRKGQFA